MARKKKKKGEALEQQDETAALMKAPTVSPSVIGRLEELPWFRKLSDDEKVIVKGEDEQLSMLSQITRRARLAAAEHLSKIRDVLGPLGVFERYLRYHNLQRTTAYRDIRTYQELTKYPQPLISVAIAKNIPLMRPDFRELLEKKVLPMSKDMDTEQAAEYLKMLEVKRKELRLKRAKRGIRPSREHVLIEDTGALMKGCFRAIRNHYVRLPLDITHTAKIEWLRTVVGAIFSFAGEKKEIIEIPVIAPPPDWLTRPGRPTVH